MGEHKRPKPEQPKSIWPAMGWFGGTGALLALIFSPLARNQPEKPEAKTPVHRDGNFDADRTDKVITQRPAPLNITPEFENPSLDSTPAPVFFTQQIAKYAAEYRSLNSNMPYVGAGSKEARQEFVVATWRYLKNAEVEAAGDPSISTHEITRDIANAEQLFKTYGNLDAANRRNLLQVGPYYRDQPMGPYTTQTPNVMGVPTPGGGFSR